MTPARRAAFLDRDGTLVEDAHFLSDPHAMRLVSGAADAVRRLNAAAVVVVVVTNQSGIARGLLTEAQYDATRARLEELMTARHARIDASYHCPHHPEITGPCECRKPGTLLYRRAAAALDLDLTRSLYVGDRCRDVEPALVLGGFARLVPSPDTPPDERASAAMRPGLAKTLGDAVADYLREVPG
jgi:histidinol-phosphate phosphatase family protein